MGMYRCDQSVFAHFPVAQEGEGLATFKQCTGEKEGQGHSSNLNFQLGFVLGSGLARWTQDDDDDDNEYERYEQ